MDEISLRRRGFYERCGFRANGFAHVQPPYHGDCAGHRLVVMSSSGVLSDEEYHAFERYLRERVMAI